MRTDKTLSLDAILDWITRHVYDSSRIGGLTGQPQWVVDTLPLLEELARLANMSDDEMHEAYDWARVRVHGPNVEGGR